MMHQRHERNEKYKQLVLSFYFVSFFLNAIAFIYNGLKQSLILEAKSNCFLQISFFHKEPYLCLFLKIILCCMWRDLVTSLLQFVRFVSISYFALQICNNLTKETLLISQEKKLTKFVYFLETEMHEISIFCTDMMVCTNLDVNYVVF